MGKQKCIKPFTVRGMGENGKAYDILPAFCDSGYFLLFVGTQRSFRLKIIKIGN